MLHLLFIFFVKVFDNILSTGKQILIQKNKGIIAAITVVISQIIFYKLINIVTKASSDWALYIIAIASGLGTYLAILISNQFSKERTYVNVIMCDNKKIMIKFRDYLKANKITNLATDGYTKDWKKSIAITAYAETKRQSKLIDNYIKNCPVKIKRIINIQ